MQIVLADLDELVLACRDSKSRAFLSEAVASYRAGAYRSTIVGTWIAVCFDLIAKIHELALSGDKEADQVAKDIDAARIQGDLPRALKFEKSILDLARQKFELISPLEQIDLERLFEDRNRCAHPSLMGDGEPFLPSAELARLHLRSAVTHLLQHPPVQGKAAMQRIQSEVASAYFPTQVEKAVIALSSGPLQRPRMALVANILVTIVKRIVTEGANDQGLCRRLIAAVGAIQRMHPLMFDIVLRDRITKLLHSAADGELSEVARLTISIPNLWENFDVGVKQRLELYVENLTDNELGITEELLKFQPFRQIAEERLRRATIEELNLVLWTMAPEIVVNKYITAYLGAKSFDTANSIAKELGYIVLSINIESIRRIIIGAKNNGEISHSFEFPVLMSKLLQGQRITKIELESLLIENGLDSHVPLSER